MEPWKIKAAAAALKLCVNQFGSSDPMRILEKCKIGEVSLPPEDMGNISTPAPINGTIFVDNNTQKRMPTTEETVAVVKQDIIDQCDQLGFDLTRGGRISGASCDCLNKHSRNIIALCREIITMDSNSAYTKLEMWLISHLPYFQPEYIDQKLVKDEDKSSPTFGRMVPDIMFYRDMLPELRGYRKMIQGTAV